MIIVLQHWPKLNSIEPSCSEEAHVCIEEPFSEPYAYLNVFQFLLSFKSYIFEFYLIHNQIELERVFSELYNEKIYTYTRIQGMHILRSWNSESDRFQILICGQEIWFSYVNNQT